MGTVCRSSIYLCVHPFISPSICLSIHPSVQLFLLPSGHPSVHPSISQVLIHQSIHLPPSKWPSICPSVPPSVVSAVQPSICPSVYRASQPSVCSFIWGTVQPSHLIVFSCLINQATLFLGTPLYVYPPTQPSTHLPCMSIMHTAVSQFTLQCDNGLP